MKKALFAILVYFVMFPIIANAQNHLIETFYLSAVDRVYGIYTDVDCSESTKLCLFYDMQAPNSEQKVQSKIVFYYKGDGAGRDFNYFKNDIKNAWYQYTQWKAIAESNNMKLISKKIPEHTDSQELYFTDNGKWYTDKYVSMWFTFYVDEDGNSYLILESDAMTSEEVVAHSSSSGVSLVGLLSGNPLVGFGSSKHSTIINRACSGASLVFSSEEEIDDFIQKVENVAEWKRNNISAGKLLNTK